MRIASAAPKFSSDPPTRKIPLDVNMEALCISSMILSDDAARNVFEIVGERISVFTDPRHSALYRAMLSLFTNGKPATDAGLIVHAARQQGNSDMVTAAFLLEIANAAPHDANAEYYAVALLEHEQKRRMITTLERSLADCYEEEINAQSLADRVEARVFECAHRDQADTSQMSMSQMLEAMVTRGQTPKGIMTGFPQLDDLLSGLQPGEMSVLAARPSVGKTALALTIADYVSLCLKQPTLMFSIEMRQPAIMQRMLSARAGVPLQNIRKNCYLPGQDKQLGLAISELSTAEFFLDDASSMTLFELRARARRMKQKHDLKLIIIDYLQLMDSSERAENRQQEITRISRGIKSLAGDLNVHILCLSQLNRASESENRRPRSSDLRESGSIEQDADVVMLVHREDVMQRSNSDWILANSEKQGDAELILSKQRNGPCGIIRLFADDENVRFMNPRY